MRVIQPHFTISGLDCILKEAQHTSGRRKHCMALDRPPNALILPSSLYTSF